MFTRLFILLFLSLISSFAFGEEDQNKVDSAEEVKAQIQEANSKTKKELNTSKKALWIAHILRDRKAKLKINDLSLRYTQVPVFLMPAENSFKPLVKIKINYYRPGWALYDIYGKSLAQGDLQNSYYVHAYLNSRISTLDVMAVGPDNQVEKERLYLFAPEAREFKTVSVFDSVLFSIGHAYLEYDQFSFGKYVAQSLLVGARYLSPEKGKRFGYFGEAFATVYTYDAPNIDESSNFFEARVGATYSAKVFKHPRTRSRITLGLNTINLYSLDEFGFSGLFGPNIGLRTEYFKSSRDSISAEIHYTGYDFSDPLSERSVKVSLDYNRALKNLRKAQVGFSYSNSEFSEGLEEVSTSLVSVYFSLSF